MESLTPETPPVGNRTINPLTSVSPPTHVPSPAQPIPHAPANTLGREMPRPRGTLQDYLALERTALANERTMLAYVRTSLALIAAAITIIKFLPGKGMLMLAYLLLPAGVICLTVGFMRYFESRAHLEKLSADNNFPEPPSVS